MVFVGFICLTCLNHFTQLLLLIIMHASMTAAVSLGCFSPKKICSILAFISFSFFALHCASEALINFGGISERFYQDFFDAINLDEEFNLTAIYSGMLLCVSSFLLKQIALSCRGGDIRDWMLLSKVFLFLAFDEVFQVHELFVISDLRRYVHPALASIWVIPYGILFALFALKFIPFFLRLRRRVAVFALIAGGVYVTGAIAFEALSSWLVRTGQISRSGFYYELISGFEELFEMLGVIIFLYALLLELRSRFVQLEYNFTVK